MEREKAKQELAALGPLAKVTELPLKTKREKIAEMIMFAVAQNVFVRAFDVRYATAGYPELGLDYLYFPEGSFEVMETGQLDGPSQSVQRLPFGKLVPIEALLLVELCLPNEVAGNRHKK